MLQQTGTRALGAVLALAAVMCLAGGARLAAATTQGEAAKPAAEQPAAHPQEPTAGQPAAQPEHAQPAAGEGHAAEAATHGEGEGEGEGHGESPWAVVARVFNFAILAGGLFYLLRSPLAGFLEQRGVSVRSELKKAAELKQDAGAQLEQIDARMKALPAEIDALKRRGAEEIAAEEARIHALAEAERRRLLDQARREIETELRIAERDLKKRAGELAVQVATERVKRTITERDQARLIDRYVAQVRH